MLYRQCATQTTSFSNPEESVFHVIIDQAAPQPYQKMIVVPAAHSRSSVFVGTAMAANFSGEAYAVVAIRYPQADLDEMRFFLDEFNQAGGVPRVGMTATGGGQFHLQVMFTISLQPLQVRRLIPFLPKDFPLAQQLTIYLAAAEIDLPSERVEPLVRGYAEQRQFCLTLMALEQMGFPASLETVNLPQSLTWQVHELHEGRLPM